MVCLIKNLGTMTIDGASVAQDDAGSALSTMDTLETLAMTAVFLSLLLLLFRLPLLMAVFLVV